MRQYECEVCGDDIRAGRCAHSRKNQHGSLPDKQDEQDATAQDPIPYMTQSERGCWFGVFGACCANFINANGEQAIEDNSINHSIRMANATILRIRKSKHKLPT